VRLWAHTNSCPVTCVGEPSGQVWMTMPEDSEPSEVESDSDAESDHVSEELLSALQTSLLAPEPSPKLPRRDVEDPRTTSIMPGEAFPPEVRLCVATFLPWQEVVAGSLLSRSWRSLELQDVLWKSYFCRCWPRLAQRQLGTAGPSPWRALFKARWASKHRHEDALEEDWLDFRAAQDLTPNRCRFASPSTSTGTHRSLIVSAAELREALKRCREELEVRGCCVPQEVVGHACSAACRFHRLETSFDAYLCEGSGALHACRPDEPCDFCVPTADESFLVCPVSGRCFEKPHEPCEEAMESVIAQQAQAWDLEHGSTQLFESWFEAGYSMTEEQAKDYFGLERASATRSRLGTECA